MRATEEILGKLELATMPRLTVFNKRDRLPPGEAERIAAGRGPTVSALDRTTLRPLLEAIERHLWPLGEDHLLEREAPDERAPDELEDHALDDDLPVAAP